MPSVNALFPSPICLSVLSALRRVDLFQLLPTNKKSVSRSWKRYRRNGEGFVSHLSCVEKSSVVSSSSHDSSQRCLVSPLPCAASVCSSGQSVSSVSFHCFLSWSLFDVQEAGGRTVDGEVLKLVVLALRNRLALGSLVGGLVLDLCVRGHCVYVCVCVCVGWLVKRWDWLDGYVAGAEVR